MKYAYPAIIIATIVVVILAVAHVAFNGLHEGTCYRHKLTGKRVLLTVNNPIDNFYEVKWTEDGVTKVESVRKAELEPIEE